MTRREFLSSLRRSLAGLPGDVVEEIAADYESHFAEAAAAGRAEHDVAVALGDPGRLGRELRVELRLQGWERRPSAVSALAAIAAVLGLGALDLAILLPVLLLIGGTFVVLFVGAVSAFLASGAYLVVEPFDHPEGGPLAAILFGIGAMAGASAVVATLLLIAIRAVDALSRYGRLHYRLLQPAAWAVSTYLTKEGSQA